MIPKFIVDNNVGKLAVWLRALGYDTLFINPIDDSDLVKIAEEENRIILTKDTGVVKRRPVAMRQVQALFVRGQDWRQQLAQVMKDLRLKTDRCFTRCLACNSLLVACDKEEARGHVPDKIFRLYPTFVKCASCARYFWEGSHWERMRGVLAAIKEQGS